LSWWASSNKAKLDDLKRQIVAKHMDAMHPVPFRVTSPTTTEAIHIEGAEK